MFSSSLSLGNSDLPLCANRNFAYKNIGKEQKARNKRSIEKIELRKKKRIKDLEKNRQMVFWLQTDLSENDIDYLKLSFNEIQESLNRNIILKISPDHIGYLISKASTFFECERTSMKNFSERKCENYRLDLPLTSFSYLPPDHYIYKNVNDNLVLQLAKKYQDNEDILNKLTEFGANFSSISPPEQLSEYFIEFSHLISEFINTLSSPNHKLLINYFLMLGNIISVSEQSMEVNFFDSLHKHLKSFTQNIFLTPQGKDLLFSYTRLCSLFFSQEPPYIYEVDINIANSFIVALSDVLNIDHYCDENIFDSLIHLALPFSIFVDLIITNEKIVNKLLTNLDSHFSRIINSSCQLVANITSVGDNYVKFLIEKTNFFEKIIKLYELYPLQDCCVPKIINNIAAVGECMIQFLFDNSLISLLIELLQTGSYQIQKDCILALTNIFAVANYDQLKLLVESDSIKGILNMLFLEDCSIITRVLEALDVCLEKSKLCNLINVVLEKLNNFNVEDRLLAIYNTSPNTYISQKALKIIDVINSSDLID